MQINNGLNFQNIKRLRTTQAENNNRNYYIYKFNTHKDSIELSTKKENEKISFKGRNEKAKARQSEINKINEYNKKIRLKKAGVNLERNPLWDCNIPYQENNFYRMIGEKGYKDFLETGIFRAKQDTKQNYNVAYFEKGRANAIYARHGGAKYILETTGDKMIEKENTYPYVEALNPETDKVRVWKLTDIQGKKYEIVLDTINDVLSK